MIHFFEYDPDFVFYGESHDFWEAVYVDKGSVEVGADERRYTISEGEITFHKPMEFHTLRAVSGQAPNLFIISFKANGRGMNFFRELTCRLDERDKHYISGIIRESRKAFVTPLNVPAEERMTRMMGDTAESEQMIRLYLETFLLNIRRHLESQMDTPNGELLPRMAFLDMPDAVAADPRFVRVLNFMTTHIEQNFSVDEIARAHMLSRSHLQAIFRKQVNCGVMDFFHRLKIDKAKELIRKRELDFSEIAFTLGYSSLSAFSKKFKQLTSQSPKSYRESVKHTFKEL